MAVVYEVKWISGGDPYTVKVTVGANETEAAARTRCIRLAEKSAVGEFTPDTGTDLEMTRYVDAFAQAPPCTNPWGDGWVAFAQECQEFPW